MQAISTLISKKRARGVFNPFMIAAISLVRERGTFEQFLSTPLSLTEIMVGKMLPYVGREPAAVDFSELLCDVSFGDYQG